MYVEKIPNRNSPPAILLREAKRENGKIRKKTLANLTHWNPDHINALQKILKGAVAVFPDEIFRIKKSLPHGHVEAILGTIRKIGLDLLIASKPSVQRNLVLAMIVNQIIHADSKASCVANWSSSSLAEELQVQDTDENDLYQAMDWLYERQNRIECKLAAKHLSVGGHALHDVSSSYYEGVSCPLIQFGYNRDGKKGKKIIVYAALTNQKGCPVSISVYPGNTADPKTVPDQIEKLRSRFGLKKVVIVGDRGMLTRVQIDHIKQYPGIGWITALRYDAIRELFKKQNLQMSLFDHQNIAEFASDLYPNERLVACYNSLMADHRKKKREVLLKATEKGLEKIKTQVLSRKKKKMSESIIGIKTGKVLNKHKMGKHFKLQIRNGYFEYNRNDQSIKEESANDGVYIIRTSEPKTSISMEEVVRSYKDLNKVEQLFKTFKSTEIRARPIRHRLAERVKAHLFICLLAYYVEWHMKQSLAPLLFEDEELEENRKVKDPVATAKPSHSVKIKKATRKTKEGLPVQSFKSLICHLGTRTRNLCSFISPKNKEGKNIKPSTIYQITEKTPLQEKAFSLLNICTQ